jgi:NAD(P)H-flavin reductase
LDSFKNLVNEIEVVTLDGSNGREGRAVDVVKNADYVMASGTLDMLKGLAEKSSGGQFSLSSTVLMHSDDYDDCYLETTEGRKNCSDDGPVFDKNIIIWDSLGA